jgi:tetratricopeptide (TPR) repeat protein
MLEPLLRPDSPVRALASYRSAEARYLLQDYPHAMQLFRQGEQLWPEYLAANPSSAFSYADTMIRSGELASGRKLLTRLIASQADKKFAPILLVRMADILARQQREAEAQIIYRNVVRFFPDNKAASSAALKLADRRFLAADTLNFGDLRDEYRRIFSVSSDFAVREEALFKAALLESLFGEGVKAL